MRKYLYVALACLALTLVAPAAQARTTTAHAPMARVHVLTIGKPGGTAVKSKAKLEATLAKGTAATYLINGQKVKCLVVVFIKIVKSNPLRPGVATLTNPSLRFGKCSISITGAKVTSVTAQNLPYNVSASDAKGDPVTVSGQNQTSPLSLTANVTAGTLKLTCTYAAPNILGRFSNKTHDVTFAQQQFAFLSGSQDCPPGPALFNAKFGPIRDVSVRGNPIVYVN